MAKNQFSHSDGMNKILWAVIVLVILAGGYLLFGKKNVPGDMRISNEEINLFGPLIRISDSEIAESLGYEFDEKSGEYRNDYPPLQETGGIEEIFRGDLNGDRFSDAIVTSWGCGVSCGQGNSIILDKDGLPQRIDSDIPWPDGPGSESPSINVISIKDGLITVVETPRIKIRYYRLESGKIVEKAVEVKVKN